MYSGEDLERFYVEYQSEWVPHGLGDCPYMPAWLQYWRFCRRDELLEFERMLETAPEVYDYSATMTDEQFNNWLAFFSRNKENIFLELRHAKNDRDEKARALEEKARALEEKVRALEEKDRIIAENESESSRKDRVIREKNKALAKRDKKIRDLEERLEELKDDS